MTNVVNQHITDNFALYNGDSCEVLQGLPDSSIGYGIHSPPFASLYTYSASERDLGNCPDYDTFAAHYNFIIRQLFRLTKPGRLHSVHCMDLPTSKANHGYIGLIDFPGIIIKAFQDAGWIYHSRVAIWKDPVTAMQRTKALGLLHKQIVKDSAMSRQGIPDTLLTFRKPGENLDPIAGNLVQKGDRAEYWIQDVRVCENRVDTIPIYDPEVNEIIRHTTGCIREYKYGEQYCANCGNKLTPRGKQNELSSDASRTPIDIWQRLASPVWMDINPSDTLQRESAREEEDERHICPLQLEVIRRCMELWSHPNDTILTPFAGIGSELYVALGGKCQSGAFLPSRRKAIGIELKESYYKQAVANCLRAEKQMKQPSLLDLMTNST